MCLSDAAAECGDPEVPRQSPSRGDIFALGNTCISATLTTKQTPKKQRLFVCWLPRKNQRYGPIQNSAPNRSENFS